ncbi:restriction endonuclease [Corynebacterium glyciniphilum]|uniref:restriction endonuclease n=1 Tax=Corynebacterium glyciniphilum TaxID=1404244 RepID=UPI003D9FCAD6
MITWDLFMHPILAILEETDQVKLRDLQDKAADATSLTSDERSEVLNSGQPRFRNRTAWACSYLFKIGAVARPVRGSYAITSLGRELLNLHPGGFTEKEYKTFASERGIELFESRSNATAPASTETASTSSSESIGPLDPVEQIDDGIQRLSSTIADELLSRLHSNAPSFFEEAVLKLLIAMGYGGAEGRATRTQLSSDGGIDGIIDQDALGLSRIYVQAKRYAPDNPVSRPAIQAFVGALQGAQAHQGVFLTTGRYTAGARDYAEAIQSRVILIDGSRLTNLMIQYGVGVQVERTISIVKVDEDFFE